MPHTVADRVRKWSRKLSAPEFSEAQSCIDYLSRRLFSEYEPTKGSGYPEFDVRLVHWLDSASREQDQQVMFRTVPYIYFIGYHEFGSLYQSALHGPVAWWLVDQLGLSLDCADLRQQLADAVQRTWFCAITDSMQIARFYHLNNIAGLDLRPDWRVLKEMGDSGKIVRFMKRCNPPLERLVLLEDFVGGGSQMKHAVEFAATLPGRPPVLLCPLVVCPKGSDSGRRLARTHKNLVFAPVLELPKGMFVTRAPAKDEPALFGPLRQCAERLHPRVCGGMPGTCYGPFGFDDTGGLVVLYTNCPDNTLPMIHHDSDNSWSALFPRSSRL